MRKRYGLRRGWAVLLAFSMLLQGGITGMVSAETAEKTIATFSAVDGETSRLLYGTTFYTDWKAGDGLPNDAATGTGADASGTAANGAHKKMVLKTTLTLTALEEGVDVATCWTQIGFRLRSAKVDGNEQAANFYYLTPSDVTMTEGVMDIAIPLSAIQTGNINWADVRQLNVTCQVTDAYRLADTGDSPKLRFSLANTRIVREFTEGEVDKEELQDLVNATIVEADFTADSVATYKQAVEAGKALLAQESATQDEVDAAALAIKTAKNNLISSAVVYKGKLQELLDETLTGDDLTAYEAAKTAARPLLEDDTATQKQVNDAVLAIVREKLAVIGAPAPGDPYDTLATFSGSNQSWSYLQGGQNFYTDWKKMDSAGTLDASGSANNGAHPYIYLQMQVAFTALSEDPLSTDCWKQIGLRLRSAAVDGQLKEAGFFYVQPTQAIHNGNGWWTLRIPLRAMSTENINWADVRELNVVAEVAQDYRLVDDNGGSYAGDSIRIGFTLGHVSLVQKIVWDKGDVNNQDGVTAEDALLALQAVTKKIDLIPYARDAADVDGEEGVSANDALMILQCATKKIGSLEQEEKKMVAFTFDDGPSENTAALLDALKERGVHATFFVIGKQAEQHPELVARMAAEGHEVGNHSYSHDGFNITGREEMIEDYDKCSDLIEEYTGKRPTLMRAVGGTSVDAISDYVVEQGLRLCGWKGGGPDYNQTDKNVVVNYYMKDGQCTIADGDLVLLHENHASSVAAALELIDLLMADGYEIVTVQELLDARANGGEAGAKYDRVISLD